MPAWESYLEEHADRFLEELTAFLRIPSVSSLSEHVADVERAAQWVAERLRVAGMETAEEELVSVINGRLEPYLTGEEQPKIRNYFLGSAKSWGTFIGGRADDPDDVEELVRIFNTEIMTGFPDTFGFTGRDPIFGGSRGGRVIEVDLSADSFESLLAAGRGDMLVRLLSSRQPDYKEKIWDQAAGSIVVEEAGGRITDLHGRALDFTRGRTLAENRGVLASNGFLHTAGLEALAEIAA